MKEEMNKMERKGARWHTACKWTRKGKQQGYAGKGQSAEGGGQFIEKEDGSIYSVK